MIRFLAVVSVLSCFLVAAFGEKAFSQSVEAALPKGGLVIEDGWAPPSLDGAKVGVAFAKLVNTSGEPITITAMQTDVADTVELHDHVMDDKGKMAMRRVEKVVVPANGELILKSGGLHFMLIGMKKVIKDGETFSIRFTPKGGKALSATFAVSQVRLIEALKSRKQSAHEH